MFHILGPYLATSVRLGSDWVYGRNKSKVTVTGDKKICYVLSFLPTKYQQETIDLRYPDATKIWTS